MDGLRQAWETSDNLLPQFLYSYILLIYDTNQSSTCCHIFQLLNSALFNRFFKGKITIRKIWFETVRWLPIFQHTCKTIIDNNKINSLVLLRKNYLKETHMIHTKL